MLVDLGDSLGAPPKKQGWTEEERQLRAQAIAAAFAAEKIDAVVFGSQDWRLGKQRLDELTANHDLPVLAANLRCDGVAPYRGYTVVQRSGLRVGIIGLTQGGVPKNCTLIDAAQAVDEVRQQWGQVDIAIAAVAANGGPQQQPDLGVDLVLNGQGRNEGSLLPLKHGWQMSCGRRGRSLQRVVLTWREGAVGWHADVQAQLLVRAQQLKQKIGGLQQRMERTKSERAKERLAGQLVRLRDEQTLLAEHLSGLKDDGSHHLLSSVNVELSDTFDDHAQAAKQLAHWNARLNEIKGEPALREASREGSGN